MYIIFDQPPTPFPSNLFLIPQPLFPPLRRQSVLKYYFNPLSPLHVASMYMNVGLSLGTWMAYHGAASLNVTLPLPVDNSFQ